MKYPLIPYIENAIITPIANPGGLIEKGILKFSFTDGDGNIGLDSLDVYPPFDTTSNFYYNLFITYYEKQQGKYVAVPLPLTNNSRIPRLTTDEQKESMKGDIEVILFINNYGSNYDTIAFDVSIADRALNVSNIIRTPDMVIKHKL